MFGTGQNHKHQNLWLNLKNVILRAVFWSIIFELQKPKFTHILCGEVQTLLQTDKYVKIKLGSG